MHALPLTTTETVHSVESLRGERATCRNTTFTATSEQHAISRIYSSRYTIASRKPHGQFCTAAMVPYVQHSIKKTTTHARPHDACMKQVLKQTTKKTLVTGVETQKRRANNTAQTVQRLVGPSHDERTQNASTKRWTRSSSCSTIVNRP